MKTLLKPRASTRPTPAAALAATSEAAPRQPPATVEQDAPMTLNVRFRASSIRALLATAASRGQTQKQVLAFALKAAGVDVSSLDLEDRTPRRKT